MPYVETVMLTIQFAQDEILLRTRLSQISSYLFRSGRDFLVLTFTSWCYWSGRPIMDESGVGLSLVSSVAPLSMGRPKIFDSWVLCQRIGDTCHDLISQEITSICLTEESATCLLFIHLCRFKCQGSLPINSWFPLLPLSFLKFPCSITLVLEPLLEVFRVHKFPSS